MNTSTSVVTINLPRGQPWSAAAASGLAAVIIEQLRARQGLILLTIRATREQISWQITAHHDGATNERWQTLVRSYYPGADFRQEAEEMPAYPFFQRTFTLARSDTLYFEDAAAASDIRPPDPLMILAQTMSNLWEGECLEYRVAVQNTLVHNEAQIEELLTISAWDAGYRLEASYFMMPAERIGFEVGKLLVGNRRLKEERLQTFSDGDTRRYLSKLYQPLALVSVELMLQTRHPQRLALLTASVASLQHLTAGAAVKLVGGFDDQTVQITNAHDEERLTLPFAAVRAWWQQPEPRPAPEPLLALTAGELAALWHLPHKEFDHLPVAWASFVPKALETRREKLARGEQTYIGHLDDGKTPISLNRADRIYHTYITGQTGMGKSTLLYNLIRADILQGQGVAVLDPHGSLIDDLMRTCIPQDRLGDVMLLDCGNTAFPVPLNPFRTPPAVSTESVLNTVLWLIRSLYADSWSSTRMETIFHNVLQLLLADPEATPLDIQVLFADPTLRHQRLDQLIENGRLSHAVRNFWQNFDALSPSEQRSQVQPVLNRLNVFLGSPVVERLTCHPQTLDFRALIRERKIVLVRLSGDAIFNAVDTLGAIFLVQFYLASISLGAQPGGQPPRFYLYVDETQRFLTTALPGMFSEARKFGLSMTLANQYLGQLEDATREGILKNVGTKISFECHPDEARLTARMYEPDVEAAQLTTLGRGMAAVKTRFQGQSLPAFLCRVDPLVNRPAQDALPYEQAIRDARTHLNLPSSAEVDLWLNRRYAAAEVGPASAHNLRDFE